MHVILYVTFGVVQFPFVRDLHVLQLSCGQFTGSLGFDDVRMLLSLFPGVETTLMGRKQLLAALLMFDVHLSDRCGIFSVATVLFHFNFLLFLP